MTRLNLDNLSGLLAIETMLSPPAPPGAAAGQNAFDEHLLRAQTAAAPAAPEDFGHRDAGRPPTPEPRRAEPPPAAPARDDTREESAGSGSPQDSNPAGVAGVPGSDAPGPPEAQDELSGRPATTDSECPNPGDWQGDATDGETATAGELGSAASARPTSEADGDGRRPAPGNAEHQEAAHPAGRRSRADKKAGRGPACAEAKVEGELAADAAPSGRAKQPTEAQATGASDPTQPVQQAEAKTAEAKPGESGGPEGAAAVVGPQGAEAQTDLGVAAAAGPSGGPEETAATSAAVLPAAGVDGPASTHAVGVHPRRGPSQAGAKGAGPSQPDPFEPDAQPAAEKPAAAQEGQPVPVAPVGTDLAGTLEATSKADSVRGKQPADVSRSGADPAAAKQGEHAGRPGGAEGAERAPGTEQADRVRFVQRVARAFESAAERGGTVRLRLHPPELGSLRLELTVRNGRMNARLEAETEAARNLIVENLSALRQRLADHQIRVERFDVDWGGRPSSNLPQQSQDGTGRQPGRAGVGPLSGVRSRGGAAAPPGPRAAPRPGSNGRFDVVV